MNKAKLIELFINGERVYDISFYARILGFNRRTLYWNVNKYGNYSFEKDGVKVFAKRNTNTY